jgi:hypothetical protein
METKAAIAGNMANKEKKVTPAAIETTRCSPIALYKRRTISNQARRAFW